MAVVELENVSVKYPVFSADARSLRRQMFRFASGGGLKAANRNRVDVLALKSISLRAEKGDRIGLVGRNGSGKSTLLRLLAGIYPPSSGRIRVDGRVAALLGGGLGIEEDVTGYEAIRYGSLLYDLTDAEVARVTPEVAAFTELGSYLSMPLKSYSAGMKIRVAFGAATSYSPDILLVDEAIGAGDAHFIEKAKRRAVEFMARSSVAFLASHSDDILRTVCNKAILLDQGDVIVAGDVDQVLELYHSNLTNTPPNNLATTSGAISNSAADGRSPSDAFNSKIVTHWESVERGDAVMGHAWIGYDFGPDRVEHVRQFTIRQWNGSDIPNMVRAVRVQCSDDGFVDDVQTVATIKIAESIARNSYEVPESKPARYWRLVAATETGGGPWGVIELVFNDFLATREMGLEPAERAIANGYITPHLPRSAFDGRLDTFWVSREADPEVEGKAWLGYDFGPGAALAIRRFALRQWDEGARPNTVGAVDLQYSDDAFHRDIHTVARVEVPRGEGKFNYDVPHSKRARYWRVLAATSTGGGHWGVRELEFSATSKPSMPFVDPLEWAPIPGGAPLAYHHAEGHPPPLAFDGDAHTYWLSADTDPGVAGIAWVGYDFGDGNSFPVTALIFQQWFGGFQPNQVASVLVQCSDDGFTDDIRTISELKMPRNSMRNMYGSTNDISARYWRLLANSPTGGGAWGVVEVQFWSGHRLIAGRPRSG